MKAIPTFALAVLATACVDHAALQAHDTYSTLVQLRGQTASMLGKHEISVTEAVMLRDRLNAARRYADAGEDDKAGVELDGIAAYLKARQ